MLQCSVGWKCQMESDLLGTNFRCNTILYFEISRKLLYLSLFDYSLLNHKFRANIIISILQMRVTGIQRR